jgi:CubicO group peptidase (beta-lactamase class C family)
MGITYNFISESIEACWHLTLCDPVTWRSLHGLAGAVEDSMPETKPDLGEVLTNHLDSVIDGALAENRIVGTVVLVLQDGKFTYRRAAGYADREAQVPMQENGIFRLASLTKPIVSATAMAMVEEGKLDLDIPVTTWIPEFKPALLDGRVPEITLRQLLTHTAGLSYGFAEPEDGPYHRANISDGLDQPGLSARENLKRIASVPLEYEPGTSWAYSVAADVAGEAIGRADHSSLPEAVERYVTGPLGLQDTSFSILDPARLVVPYADGSPRPTRMKDLQVVPCPYGSIRFAPGRVFDPDSYPSGGCGMVGTADDFAKFLETLRTGGSPILTAGSVRMITTNQSSGRGRQPGVAFGFGMSVIIDPVMAGLPQSPGTFAWGGVYGHSWFVDPTLGLTVVALTNTTGEGVFGQFPVEIRDAVYAARNVASQGTA